jgi:hypothetical protein
MQDSVQRAVWMKRLRRGASSPIADATLLCGVLLIFLLGCSSKQVPETERNPAEQTATQWKITFSNAIPPPRSVKGEVLVTIESNQKTFGKILVSHAHSPGDRIGWWPERQGAEPVSVHRTCLSSGATLDVDFDTGLALSFVEAKTEVFKLSGCKALFGPDGTQEGCAPITEQRPFPVTEIGYVGPDGEKRLLVPDLSFDSRTSRFCSMHEKAPPNKPIPGGRDSAGEDLPRKLLYIGSVSKEDYRRFVKPLLDREGIPCMPVQQNLGKIEFCSDNVENARSARTLVKRDSVDRGYDFSSVIDSKHEDNK